MITIIQICINFLNSGFVPRENIKCYNENREKFGIGKKSSFKSALKQSDEFVSNPKVIHKHTNELFSYLKLIDGIFQKYISYIHVEPEDGLVSVKIENDSALNIIKCPVNTTCETDNSTTPIATNDRALSELTSLRQKYSQVVFELQKSKETINLLSSERDKLKGKCESIDAEKEVLLQTIETSLKKNESDLVTLKQEKDAEASKMKMLKKENDELRARLKQIQSNMNRNVPARRHEKCHEGNEKNVYKVQKLLNHKENKSGRMFFVRWKGFGPEEDSWIAESDLLCPNLLKSYIKKKTYLIPC